MPDQIHECAERPPDDPRYLPTIPSIEYTAVGDGPARWYLVDAEGHGNMTPIVFCPWCGQRLERAAAETAPWISTEYGPTSAGGQVWVAYPNPHHLDGWNLRIQWTPLQSEMAIEPLYWCPVERPAPPPKPGGDS